MLAVRKNRYVILPKDFEKAYKNVVRKQAGLWVLGVGVTTRMLASRQRWRLLSGGGGGGVRMCGCFSLAPAPTRPALQSDSFEFYK